MLAQLRSAALAAMSRVRNGYFRMLGVRIEGYAWLRRIEIPRDWSSIRIGNGAALDNGVTLICSGPPTADKLVIGENVYMNRYTIVDAHESLVIEASVMMGPNCYLTDGDHGMVQGQPIASQPMQCQRVVIGEGAWIGAGVTILKGVRIGKGAVIGAGSVVTRDVPDNFIAVGLPAKRIAERPKA